MIVLHKPIWGFLAILSVAVALRLYHLDFQNLWLDEALTWWDSQLPFGLMLWEVSTNIHPPGGYVLAKLWTHWFGASPAMLRFPFLLCSVAIVVLTFRLARRLLSTETALLAALLLALSPHQIYFAQEARMYSLATALTLGGVLSYVRLWEKQWRSWPDRVGFVLLFALALHTHYFTACILFALALHYVYQCLKEGRAQGGPARQTMWRSWQRGLQQQSWPSWVLMHVGVVLVCLPWLLEFLANMDPGGRQQWRPALTWSERTWRVVDLFYEMVVGYNVYLGDLSYSFKNYLKYPGAWDAALFFLNRSLIYVAGGAAIAGMLGRGAWALWRKAPLALLLFSVPLVIVIGLMLALGRQMQLSRYLMVASPYFMIVLAAGTSSVRRRWLKVAAGLAILVAMTLALVRYYSTRSRNDDYRPVAAAIEREYKPGDAVIVDPHYMDRCLTYYFRTGPVEHAIIDTEYIDRIEKYFSAHRSLPRVWLVLDYRSRLFTITTEQLRPLVPTYTIEFDHRFKTHGTDVWLLRLRSEQPAQRNVTVLSGPYSN